MLVAGYWGQREETRARVAAGVVDFLSSIALLQPDVFSSWFRKGSSKAEALKSPLSIDHASVARELSQNHTDADSTPVPIPDLGYSFSAWNGRESSFSATIGAYSQHVGNAVNLKIHEPDLDKDVFRALLEQLVSSFDPDEAVVATIKDIDGWEWGEPRRGRLVYRRAQGISAETANVQEEA